MTHDKLHKTGTAHIPLLSKDEAAKSFGPQAESIGLRDGDVFREVYIVEPIR